MGIDRFKPRKGQSMWLANKQNPPVYDLLQATFDYISKLHASNGEPHAHFQALPPSLPH
jgi:hypothetical protein